MLSMYLALVEEAAEKLRFEDIYRGCRKQMLMVANRMLLNMEDAEDAVQEALAIIAGNMDAIRDQEEWAVRAYVLTAAKNAALKIMAKRQRYHETAAALRTKPEEDETLFDRVTNCMDYQLLLRAIKQLDPKYREVLMLVYVQQQSTREAARILGRREDTVRQQLSRGRKILIDICKKEGLNYGQD